MSQGKHPHHHTHSHEHDHDHEHPHKHGDKEHAHGHHHHHNHPHTFEHDHDPIPTKAMVPPMVISMRQTARPRISMTIRTMTRKPTIINIDRGKSPRFQPCGKCGGTSVCRRFKYCWHEGSYAQINTSCRSSIRLEPYPFFSPAEP